MNIYIYSFIYALLTAFTNYISFCMLLIFPLKIKQKIFFVFYTTIIIFFNYIPEKFISDTLCIPLAIIGSIFLIFLFQKHYFVNFICSCLNYFLFVLINHVFLFIVYNFNITIHFLKNNLFFECFLLLSQCLVFYFVFLYLGNRLRNHYSENFLNIMNKKNKSLFFFYIHRIIRMYYYYYI